MWNLFDLLASLVLPALLFLAACFVVPRIWQGIKAVLFLHIEYRERVAKAQQVEAETKIIRLPPGNVVVPYDVLSQIVREQFVATAAYHVANATALPAHVPHTITYSPHISRLTGSEPAQLDVRQDMTDAFVVPTFTELHRAGIINPTRILVGYHEETHEPFFGSLRDLFSCLIIAKSGGGKTTLERYLVAQASMMGAKFATIDPDGMNEQGLARALRPLSAHQLFAPAIESKDIEQTMHYFLRMVENRRKGKDTSTDNRILAIDEINHLIDDLGDGFAVDMARIAEQGRKYNVFVFAAGQSAESGRTGGTAAMRKAFVGRFVLRHDKDAVQRLIPDKKLLDMVPRLQNGHTIFVPTLADPVPLAIPNTTEADLSACFGSQVVEPVTKPVAGAVPSPVPQLVHEPQSWVDTSARAELVRQLFKAGKSQTQIIADVWGVDKKGREWQQASVELNGILRSLIP